MHPKKQHGCGLGPNKLLARWVLSERLAERINANTTPAFPATPQVPRLVARIAELEERLYSSEAGDRSLGEDGGLLDRFGGLLRKAQQGLDAGIAYV